MHYNRSETQKTESGSEWNELSDGLAGTCEIGVGIIGKGNRFMFGIIVGTHGRFAEELVKSCEMICGQQKNVRAVTLIPGEGPDDVVAKYEAAIKELDCEGGVLFLNDLFGGSPYNAACRLVIANEAYGIVTGVSLPMLIEMVSTQLMDDGSDIKALMEKAIEAGKNGVQTFHASAVADDEEEDF